LRICPHKESGLVDQDAAADATDDFVESIAGGKKNKVP